MLNASEHHFVLAFESVMSKSFCAPLWILVWGLLMCGPKKTKRHKIMYQEFHTLELSLRYNALVGREGSEVYSDILTLTVSRWIKHRTTA